MPRWLARYLQSYKPVSVKGWLWIDRCVDECLFGCLESGCRVNWLVAWMDDCIRLHPMSVSVCLLSCVCVYSSVRSIVCLSTCMYACFSHLEAVTLLSVRPLDYPSISHKLKFLICIYSRVIHTCLHSFLSLEHTNFILQLITQPGLSRVTE